VSPSQNRAAHVRPLPAGGEHRIDNGPLLRSDVHTLFDRGYLAVDPRYRLQVSPRLRSEFGNGEQFYTRAGSTIALPERRTDRPHRDLLEWHLDEVFKANSRPPEGGGTGHPCVRSRRRSSSVTLEELAGASSRRLGSSPAVACRESTCSAKPIVQRASRARPSAGAGP